MLRPYGQFVTLGYLIEEGGRQFRSRGRTAVGFPTTHAVAPADSSLVGKT